MEADLASNLPPAADGKGKEEVVHDPTFERGEFRHLERAHSRPAMIRVLKIHFDSVYRKVVRQARVAAYIDSPWMVSFQKLSILNCSIQTIG